MISLEPEQRRRRRRTARGALFAWLVLPVLDALYQVGLIGSRMDDHQRTASPRRHAPGSWSRLKRVWVQLADTLLLPWRALLVHFGLSRDAISQTSSGRSNPVVIVWMLAVRFVWLFCALAWSVLGTFVHAGQQVLFVSNLFRDDVTARRVTQSWAFWQVLTLLVGATGFAVGLGWLRLHGSRASAETYMTAARSAFEAEDFPTLEVCAERLRQLQPALYEPYYWLAVCADRAGQAARRDACLAVAAPEQRTGVAAAHRWRAELLLAAEGHSPDAVREALGHVMRALHAAPEDKSAAELAARLLIADGQWATALPYLSATIEAHPEWRYLLARWYASQGRADEARDEARLALAWMRARLDSEPGQESLRRLAASAAAFLNDYAAAVELIAVGRERHDSPELRAEQARLLVAWADVMVRDDPTAAERQVRLLEQALEVDGPTRLAVERLIHLRQAGGETGARVARILLDTRWEAADADVRHALGLDAWKQGLWSTAREHLQAARHLKPDDPQLANNLAWMLSTSEPVDLKRALQLTEVAVRRQPVPANFWDTRGRILARLERWDEARLALEQAAVLRPDDEALGAVLATCYEHLGLPAPTAAAGGQPD